MQSTEWTRKHKDRFENFLNCTEPPTVRLEIQLVNTACKKLLLRLWLSGRWGHPHPSCGSWRCRQPTTEPPRVRRSSEVSWVKLSRHIAHQWETAAVKLLEPVLQYCCHGCLLSVKRQLNADAWWPSLFRKSPKHVGGSKRRFDRRNPWRMWNAGDFSLGCGLLLHRI